MIMSLDYQLFPHYTYINNNYYALQTRLQYIFFLNRIFVSGSSGDISQEAPKLLPQSQLLFFSGKIKTVVVIIIIIRQPHPSEESKSVTKYFILWLKMTPMPHFDVRKMNAPYDGLSSPLAREMTFSGPMYILARSKQQFA